MVGTLMVVIIPVFLQKSQKIEIVLHLAFGERCNVYAAIDAALDKTALRNTALV